MTDKERFRAEIERRIESTASGVSANILIGLIKFLDSLPEEPVSEDLEEEVGNYINSHFSEGCDGCLIPDKNKALGGVTFFDIKDLARHFACWQKEQMTKGAMPRIVKSLDAASYNHCIAHLGLSGDDKVKLIIIKDS